MRAEKLGQAGKERRHAKKARQCHANSALITKHAFTAFDHMTGNLLKAFEGGNPLWRKRGDQKVLFDNVPGQFGKG